MTVYTMPRRLIFFLLRWLGLPWLIRETLQRHAVTIILFHDVLIEDFRQQIEVMRKRYAIISLQDYLRAREDLNAPPLPAKALVITLDDGHRGNFALLETLEQIRVPVTIFLCSGIVGTNRHYWFQRGFPRAEIEALKMVNDAERLLHLRQRDFEEEREYEERQALSWDEVRAMMPCVDFQAHTVTHPILPNCDSEKSRREIGDSKRQLEDRLGSEINAISYPNGDYSEREIELAKLLGYRCGITVDAGFNTTASDPFRLKRIYIDDGTEANELIVRASGLWDALRAIVKRPKHGLRQI